MCWQKCKQHQVVEREASVKRHSPAKFICNFGHSSCLESLFTLSLYDELSAAVEGGWGSTDTRHCLPPPPQQHTSRCPHNYNQCIV